MSEHFYGKQPNINHIEDPHPEKFDHMREIGEGMELRTRAAIQTVAGNRNLERQPLSQAELDQIQALLSNN